MNIKKISRNDPCSCGSGKKYKQCCQLLEIQQVGPNTHTRESLTDLFKQALRYQHSENVIDAEKTYQKILAIWPKHIDSLNNLGLLAIKTGRINMAIELLEKAIRFEPSPLLYSSLGQALVIQKQHDKAIECLQKALVMNPSDTQTLTNLGCMLSIQNRYEEALFYLNKSITLNPKQDATLSNLAFCFIHQGKYKEAAECLRDAIAVNPMMATHYSNLLFCLCFDRNAFPDIYLKEARRLDKLLTSRSIPYQQWPNTLVTPNQPLRIGFVSGDLHNHPVSYFLESIIYHLNPERVQLFAYTTRHIEDELTARIKPYFEQWSDITFLNDITAAQKIHDDGIHILIDLAGHSAFNRLSLFAWQPAPIQVSWLGYFASTGLSFIDYFLADPIAVPESNLRHFSESVWYLPQTRLCFTPPSAEMYQELTPLPADNNGFITFGCFQSLSKINHKMVSLWAKILQEHPNSKLMFKNNQLNDRASKQELIDKLIVCQITMDRVIFAGGSPREAYLSAYGLVDFMLDTSPYPGGTTTCEALWMGVPTLTLTGDTLLEKQGMGMLSCVGLQDWVAYNVDDYVLKAITHAKNINNLRQLRQQLRATMKASPLVDATRFAQHLESVFEKMWLKRNDTELSKLTKIDT